MGSRVYTQLMLDQACRRRYKIDYELGCRLSGHSLWLPVSVKDCLREVFYYRDAAIASKNHKMDFEARGYTKWFRRVTENISRDLPAIELAKVEKTVYGIIEQYTRAHGNTEQKVRYVQSKGKPVVRHLSIFSVRRCDEGKLGGPTQNKFAVILDGLWKDSSTPVLTVRHFTSQSDPEKVKKYLESNLEVPGMLYAASLIARRPVRVVQFDVVRTKSPSMPTFLKCRKCGGDGCEECAKTGYGAISSKPCDTTAAVWREALGAYPHIETISPEADRLLAVLESRGDTFTYRHYKTYSDANIAEWMQDTYEKIRDVEAARKANRWPRNHSACRQYGHLCRYARFCSGAEGPDLVQFNEEYPGLVTWTK